MNFLIVFYGLVALTFGLGLVIALVIQARKKPKHLMYVNTLGWRKS